jgi:hypothetical protein
VLGGFWRSGSPRLEPFQFAIAMPGDVGRELVATEDGARHGDDSKAEFRGLW